MAEQVLRQQLQKLEHWQERFDEFMQAIAQCFTRIEPTLHAQQYTSTLRWGFGKGCRHMVSLASPIAQLEFAA